MAPEINTADTLDVIAIKRLQHAVKLWKISIKMLMQYFDLIIHGNDCPRSNRDIIKGFFFVGGGSDGPVLSNQQ